MLTITVIGTPGPQGSKAFKGMRGGHACLVESSKLVAPWRHDVGTAAIKAMGGAGLGVKGDVAISMVFTLKKPKSAPKSRITYPSTKPDGSKLVRSTEDALVTVGAIDDDARIVAFSAVKLYAGNPGALTVPGAVITIMPFHADMPNGLGHAWKVYSAGY